MTSSYSLPSTSSSAQSLGRETSCDDEMTLMLAVRCRDRGAERRLYAQLYPVAWRAVRSRTHNSHLHAENIVQTTLDSRRFQINHVTRSAAAPIVKQPMSVR